MVEYELLNFKSLSVPCAMHEVSENGRGRAALLRGNSIAVAGEARAAPNRRQLLTPAQKKTKIERLS
jgi:hypothetical protein